MAKAKQIPPTPEWVESNRVLVMFTSIMLILLTFFILLVSTANYDESKHGQVWKSLQESFGFTSGGPLAIGDDIGNSFNVIGTEQGQAAIANVEMARIRGLLAPNIMDSEANIIHSKGQKIVSLSAGLLFGPDEISIKPEMEATLLAFCQIMSSSEIPISIEGHTDNQPPQTQGVGDNWDISFGRAMSVFTFFTERGNLKPDRLTIFAYGGEKPRYANATPAGRAKNNRVDLVLDFEKVSADKLRDFSEKTDNWDFQGFDFPIKE